MDQQQHQAQEYAHVLEKLANYLDLQKIKPEALQATAEIKLYRRSVTRLYFTFTNCSGELNIMYYKGI